MFERMITSWKSYCIDENFVGIGSTRKAYRAFDYVIKVNIHPIGYKQSQNEMKIYHSMVKKGFNALFAETYYVDSFISIQKYYTPLELKNNQTYEINVKQHRHLLPESFEQALDILDKEFDCFDLHDSSNYGLNENGKLVFTDYGMTKGLYENEWVPLAEKGILPQIYFDVCTSCGVEKELRMYGENDRDRRCFDCGKE